MSAEQLMALLNDLDDEEKADLLATASRLYETATNVPSPGAMGPLVRSAVHTLGMQQKLMFGSYAGDVPLDAIPLNPPPEALEEGEAVDAQALEAAPAEPELAVEEPTPE